LVNHLQNSLRLPFYFGTSKPKNANPLFLHPLIANTIILSCLFRQVAIAIDFDYQFGGDTVKVCRVNSQWMLTTKFLIATLPISQKLPHLPLKFVSHLTA